MGDVSWQPLTEGVRTVVLRELGISVAFLRSGTGVHGAVACCIVDDDWRDVVKAASASAARGEGAASEDISDGSGTDAFRGDSDLPDLALVTILERSSRDRPTVRRFVASTDAAGDGPRAFSLKQHLRDLEGIGGTSPRFDTCVEEFSESNGVEVAETHEGLSDEDWFAKVLDIYAGHARHFVRDSAGALILVPRGRGASSKRHPNVDTIVLAVSTERYHFLFTPYAEHTLEDVLNFHAHAIGSSTTKRALIIKQLLASFSEMHSGRGLCHGSFSAADVLVDQNLWIRVVGWERQCFARPSRSAAADADAELANFTEQWCNGEMSNFDYVLKLNKRSGRHWGDPSLHPIMPWVTDFSGDAPLDGFRDLGKSKYRLNKGDEQLDIQFADAAPGSTPHHITDLLSDVTYFVYLARRTPVAVLRKFVRSKYEPNEYPASVRRVFEWTPDECIPEFYTDPAIFTSTHGDMPDLQLPQWASSPEEFVRLHRAALESDRVSERLHEWIDLTFGYKLTGEAAVVAKNLALPLTAAAASPDRLVKHGIHQLFASPHPKRRALNDRSTDSASALLGEPDNPRELTVRDRFLNAFAALSIAPPAPLSRRGSPPVSVLNSPPEATRKGHNRNSSSTVGGFVMRHQRSLSKPTPDDPPPQLPGSPLTEVPQSPVLRDALIEAFADSFSPPSPRKPGSVEALDFVDPLSTFEAVNCLSSSIKDSAQSLDVPEVASGVYRSPSGFLPLSEDRSAFPFSKDVFDLGCTIFRIAATSESLGSGEHASEVQPFRTEAAIRRAEEAGSISTIEGLLRLLPSSFRSPLRAMLSPFWWKRPSVSALLLDSSSPVVYDSNTCLPFPLSANVLYEYLAEYEAAGGDDLVGLTSRHLQRLCGLDDESFDLVLLYVLPLFTSGAASLDAWRTLFEPLSRRMGPVATERKLLKPLAYLLETHQADAGLCKLLFSAPFLKQLLRRFGTLSFCEKVLQLYLPDSLQGWLSSVPAEVDMESMQTVDGTYLVLEAILGICSMLGPILTGKYATQQLLSVVLRDSTFSPLVHYLVVLLGSRFGELFIVHQFLPILKSNVERLARPGGPSGVRATAVVNALSLMEKFAMHLTLPSLVSELNEMATTLSRLIESLTLSELDLTDDQRKVICVRAFSYLVRVADLVNGQADWRPQILPLVIRFFAGAVRFVGQSRKTTDPSRPNLSIYSPEVVGQVFASFQALMGRELITRVPTSSSIERMLRERPSDEDRAFEDRLASVVTRTNSGNVFESIYWTGESTRAESERDMKGPSKEKVAAPRRPQTSGQWATGRIARSVSMPLEHNGQGSASSARKFSGNESTPDTRIGAAQSMSNLGAQLSDTSDFGLSTDSILTRPLKGSDAKGKGVWKPRPEVVEDRNAWARLLSTTNEVSRETTEMTFRDLKLRTYVGHSSRVNVVAQDECSRLLGTGSRDRTVKLWSLNSIHRDIEHGIGASEAAHTYTGHQRTVTDVCFLENSVASCDGAIHLWSVESGQLLHQFEGKSRVVSVISSPTTVIGATVDNFLSFWNLRDPVRTHRWRAGNAHAGNIRCIAMCPAERTVVVGFATGVCSLLDRRTGMILASWRAHEGEVSQVAFYTTRFVVTSCGADRAINIWDTTNLTSVRTFRDSNEIASFEVQEDDLVILGAAGNGLNFVSLSSNFQSYFAKLKTRSPITSMGLARLNGLFALGCAEGEVVVYA